MKMTAEKAKRLAKGINVKKRVDELLVMIDDKIEEVSTAGSEFHDFTWADFERGPTQISKAVVKALQKAGFNAKLSWIDDGGSGSYRSKLTVDWFDID